MEDWQEGLIYIDRAAADKATGRRQELLDRLPATVEWAFNRTKPYYLGLSPGCRLCGYGSWSCLFMNNLCDARCFFCPSEQKERGEPQTNALQFGKVHDYIDYIDRFHFRGVSISGGEPFLSFDRSMNFISRLKRKAGHRPYIWLYTNGLLASEQKLQQLHEAGLNEIRFNLCAQNYKLDKVALATKIIDTVTVEIPAIPEDLPVLKQLVVELAGFGVKYLNLHQLRCTAHNARRLVARKYTFLPGEFVAVLESELAALELLQFVSTSGSTLAVNYCSSAYRQRFQRRNARLRAASLMTASHEDLTDNGYIRCLSISGAQSALDEVQRNFEGNAELSGRWQRKKERIYLRSDLLELISGCQGHLHLSYAEASLLPTVSYRNVFRQMQLNQKRSVVIERKTITPEISLSLSESGLFSGVRSLFGVVDLFLEGMSSSLPGPFKDLWLRIGKYERVAQGLSDYSGQE